MNWTVVRYYLEYAKYSQVIAWAFQTTGRVSGIPSIPGI